MGTFTTIETLVETLKGCQRYLKIVNSHGEDITIASIPKCDFSVITVEFHDHMGETYTLDLWIGDNGELHVENPETREDVCEYAEDWEWTEEEVRYIKFGK
jgi:hypothetical protein